MTKINRPVLPPRHRLFVDAFLVSLNGAKAARDAGYSGKSAKFSGHELLQRPEIKAAITEAMARRSARTEITQDRVLQELALIGFADMGDYLDLDEDGVARLDLSNLPEGATKVIAEITQDVYVDGRGKKGREVKKTKLKLHDKRGALVDMARHLGMFIDRFKIERDALDDLSPDELTAIAERLKQAGVGVSEEGGEETRH